jgi:AcrR family transcriptional regulator
MPARPKTSDDEIIEATLTLFERNGRDGFSMSEIADAVGIRAPSLFGRFKNRAELLDKVELTLWRALARDLAAATKASEVSKKPVEALTAQAHAYRAFAKANPNGYALMFDPRAAQSPAGAAARAAALAPCAPAFVALVGERNALAAARVLTPFLHGFVSMELTQAFRLGGDVDRAFETGVGSIIEGLTLWHKQPESK